MDEKLAAVAAAHHGLVVASEAAAAGVTRATVRWAVRSGHLRRLAQGVWCPTELWEKLDVRERHLLHTRGVQRLRPEAVACAESAAVVLNLPLPADPPAQPLLLRARYGPRNGGEGSRDGSRGRRAWLAPDEVLVLADGLRTTTPARTVVDLARHLPRPWALAAADAVRRFHGATADELLAAAQRNPCAPGHPAAVFVAQHADPWPESPLESVARAVMIALALPSPEPQVWIGAEWPSYRVDLLVREHWTVVEADGKVKYSATDPTAPDRVWQDKQRRDDLHDWGFEVVRFVMADVRRPELWGRRCVRSFERAHERRGLPIPDWGSRLKWL